MPSATLTATMPDLRDVVQKEMKRRGWTAYRLIQELDGRVKAGTVYGFLRENKPTDINSTDLGAIFDALGLVAKRSKQQGRSGD